jgi:hypothetical protein
MIQARNDRPDIVAQTFLSRVELAAGKSPESRDVGLESLRYTAGRVCAFLSGTYFL